MEERTYFISEVSKLVGVEPHVLRYWEEELGISIQRNSQGKRCYSKKDVEWFREVKYWKDKGMQLKAVKELLGNRDMIFDEADRKASSTGEMDSIEGPRHTEEQKNAEGSGVEASEGPAEAEFSVITVEEPSDSMKLFEQLLDGIIGRALEKNNERLVREICDVILQELDDKLDARMERLVQQELMQEMLREGQRESAAASQKSGKGLWRRWKRWLEQHT